MKTLALVFLLLSTVAHADLGSCSGGALAGTVGLALVHAGATDSVSAQATDSVFGAAECACASDDLLLDVFLTAAFPQGTVGSAELWAGDRCDTNALARTTAGENVCENIASVDFEKFVVGSGNASGHIYLPIPSLALFSPVVHQCPSVNQSSGLYVLLFTGASSSPSGVPAASCALDLTEGVESSGAPSNSSVAVEDSSVIVSWSPPPETVVPPNAYQILCADAAGNPIGDPVAPPIYSTCVNGKLNRRPLPIGGSLTGSPGGYSDGSAGSGGTLAELDARFVCSPEMPQQQAEAYSRRVSGLDNGKSYQFIVVGVDEFGNAAASSVLHAQLASPPATSSGCSAAGASGTTGAWGFFLLVVCVGGIGLRSRSRSRLRF